MRVGFPSVTVVIPCFNHGRFVAEAVNSCLAQEGCDLNVVLVNDGSTDGTSPAACDAAAGPRVSVIHQQNRGLPATRNRGAEAATGEFLVFLDADDTIRPGFISKLHAAILAGDAEGKQPVSHAYCQEELSELGHGIWRVPEWDPMMLLVTNLHPVTTLIRAKVFKDAGGFDATMTRGYEDWEFWLKISERGYRGVRVAEPLFIWRRHSHVTMVMEAVTRHESLYREIIARHEDLYKRNERELLILSNCMLRKFDCNWIDETGFPIPLQYLWRCRDQAWHEAESMRAWYEQTAAVRLHRTIQGKLGGMPAPIASVTRRVLKWLKGRIPSTAR